MVYSKYTIITYYDVYIGIVSEGTLIDGTCVSEPYRHSMCENPAISTQFKATYGLLQTSITILSALTLFLSIIHTLSQTLFGLSSST